MLNMRLFSTVKQFYLYYNYVNYISFKVFNITVSVILKHNFILRISIVKIYLIPLLGDFICDIIIR